MSTLIFFLYALVVVIALLLIGLILIQPAKSGGMGAAFGGVGESVFGGKAGSHLTKATVVLTTLFFVVILILGTLIGHGVKSGDERGLGEAAAVAAAEAAKKAETEKKNEAVKPMKVDEKVASEKKAEAVKSVKAEEKAAPVKK